MVFNAAVKTVLCLLCFSVFCGVFLPLSCLCVCLDQVHLQAPFFHCYIRAILGGAAPLGGFPLQAPRL